MRSLAIREASFSAASSGSPRMAQTRTNSPWPMRPMASPPTFTSASSTRWIRARILAVQHDAQNDEHQSQNRGGKRRHVDGYDLAHGGPHLGIVRDPRLGPCGGYDTPCQRDQPDHGQCGSAPDQPVPDRHVFASVCRRWRSGDCTRPQDRLDPRQNLKERNMQDDNAYGIAAGELRQFIEQYEQLEAEKKDVTEQQKELMAEAKARGYDTKVMRKVIALRKRDKDDIAEEEAILEMYKAALGMV